MKTRILASSILGLVLGATAFAGGAVSGPGGHKGYSGFYVGAGVIPAGNSDTRRSADEFSSNFVVISGSSFNGGIGGKFFVGYRLSKHWAAEAAYLYLGNDKLKFTGHINTTQAFSLAFQTRNMAGTLTALALLPVSNDRVQLFAKFGVGYINGSVHNVVATPSTLTAGSFSDYTFVYGIGGQYNVTQRVSARAEYTLLNSSSITNLRGGEASFSLVIHA